LVGQSGGNESLIDEPVFLRRENMLADGEIVAVAIDELEGKHEPSRSMKFDLGFSIYELRFSEIGTHEDTPQGPKIEEVESQLNEDFL
jgi:hypothetical protein